MERGEYGEIIVSTVPEHHHVRQRHGLTDRIQQLGIPVTVIPPELDNWGPVEGFPEGWGSPASVPASATTR